MDTQNWLRSLKSRLQREVRRKKSGLRRNCKRRAFGHAQMSVERLEERQLLTAETVVLPGVAPEYTVYVQGDEFLPVETDPGSGLVNSDHLGDGDLILLGDWQTPRRFDGWTIENATSPTVNDGSLSARFSVDSDLPLRLTLPTISSGPNLDYGYNDYLQIRMKLPSNYDQDVTFHYDTTTSLGFDDARRFVLPAAEVPADGDWHDYRFDLGLEVQWRDQLDGFAIEVPTGTWTGSLFQIDSVSVGDQPGDVLLVNFDVHKINVPQMTDEVPLQSKHATTWYSPSLNPEFDPATQGLHGLRMIEESYQVFHKVYGFVEPFYGTHSRNYTRGNYADVSFRREMPAFQTREDFTVSTTVDVEGRRLTLESTLAAAKSGGKASIYNNQVGVFPVLDPIQFPDQHEWSSDESLELQFRLLEDGQDVTSQFDLTVTDVLAQWYRQPESAFAIKFSGQTGNALGQVNFPGGDSKWETNYVKPLEPIHIGSNGESVQIDLLNPYQDHFRFQGLQVVVSPLESDTSAEKTHNYLPDYEKDRFKVNHITWSGGAWAGDYKGHQLINVRPESLHLEHWDSTVSHEYAHTVQASQEKRLDGGHWESHANFLRGKWASYYSDVLDVYQRPIYDQVLVNSQLRQDSQRFRYNDFRIHDALEDHGSAVGIDPLAGSKFWTEGSTEGSIYEQLDEITPDDVNIADVIGRTLRTWSVLDLSSGDELREQLWGSDVARQLFEYRVGSHLVPIHDRPDWFQVPLSRAPEKFGYMFHELEPTDRAITVNLEGVDVIGVGEDWRWSMIAINDKEEFRYSDVWGPGENTFELNDNEEKVFLVVVATPEDLSLDTSSYFHQKATDKHIDRLRYPYALQIRGADITPKKLNLDNSPHGDFHRNPDGSLGGWVDGTASVAPTAWVGPDARVLGRATVSDFARIEDFAVVTNNAVVRDNAVISGFAAVGQHAVVSQNATIRDRGMVWNAAKVSGNAVVEDYGVVSDAHVTDSAIVRGSATSTGVLTNISGTAILDHDYHTDFSVSDGVHQNHIAYGAYFPAYYSDTARKPNGLTASYRIEAPEGEMLWDEFGAQHAYLRGTPVRVPDAEAKGEVLSLNGQDQYVVAQRGNYSFRDGAVAAWVRPGSQDSNQRVFYAGNADGDYFEVITRDSEGKVVARIHANDVTYETTSRESLAIDEWSHIAVTFDGNTMKLYVNSILNGEVAAPLTPSDVLGPGDYSKAEALYIGRSDTGDFFEGRLDDIRFYNVTLSPAEVAKEASRRGAVLNRFYTDAPAVFDGSTTRDESGVRNGLARTLTASIKPQSSARTTHYEAIFDSNDNRSNRAGSGFGLDDGEIVVRLDNFGMWRTGVKVKMRVWQEVTVAFDGTQAHLYVDQVHRGSVNYQADPSNLAPKNYRIGFGESDHIGTGSELFYFHGEIRNAMILDRMQLPGVDFPQLSVSIDATEISETSGVAATTGTVTRNSDVTHPLTVALFSNDTTEATVVATATIAAGQSSTTFPINAVDDNIVDGRQTVAITSSAAGHAGASAMVDVLDNERFRLSLAIQQTVISESAGFNATTGTVSRTGDADRDLILTLMSDDTSEATVIGSVTIPAGASTSAPFTINAVDDDIVDGPQTVTITAIADGIAVAANTLVVTDEDVPTLALDVVLDSVSENAGAGATTATVSRNTDTTRELIVTLFSDDTTEATVVGSVTIPAGARTSAPFDVDAVDDGRVDGPQTAVISATADGFVAGVDTLLVADGNVPSLTLDVVLDSISENAGVGATTATVSRNTDSTNGLVVTLLSDDTSKARVVERVTIPAGATTSAPFAIDAIDDDIVAGDRVVTFTASVHGFVDGIDSLNVTDDDLPEVAVSATAASVVEGADATFTVSLSQIPITEVMVTIVTSDGTALAGKDYRPISQTLTFLPGQTSQTVRVETIDNNLVETPRTFTVQLLNVSGASITSEPSAIGTVVSEDMPTVSIASTQSAEGNALVFVVSLDQLPAAGNEVVVNLTTTPDSARSPEDFVAADQTLVFRSTDRSLLQDFSISTTDDDIAEQDERLFAEVVSVTGGMVKSDRAVGTITDDDLVNSVSLSLDQTTVSEAHWPIVLVTVTAERNVTHEQSVRVELLGRNVDATDAVLSQSHISIPAGSNIGTATLRILDDRVLEGHEQATLRISDPTGNLRIDVGSQNLIILDNERRRRGTRSRFGRIPFSQMTASLRIADFASGGSSSSLATPRLGNSDGQSGILTSELPPSPEVNPRKPRDRRFRTWVDALEGSDDRSTSRLLSGSDEFTVNVSNLLQPAEGIQLTGIVTLYDGPERRRSTSQPRTSRTATQTTLPTSQDSTTDLTELDRLMSNVESVNKLLG